MSAARTHEMNFLAPPVVRVIGMRSLVIGLVFSALAFLSVTSLWNLVQAMVR